jgi:hypothetical protein
VRRPVLILIGLAAALPCHAQAMDPRALSPDWQTYVEPEHGTRAEYPAGVFLADAGPPTIGDGKSFETDDGTARLEIYALENSERDSPASYVAKKFAYRRSELEYDRIARGFFALSGVKNDMVYYSRCNFPGGRRGAIHCVYLTYPHRETKAWDAIVTRVSWSLRPKGGR